MTRQTDPDSPADTALAGIPEAQREVASFLLRLAGQPPVTTHISAVFVGRDTAWKLKKAVRLPFLDFSTLAARRHFLDREYALNAAAAPGLYRDVVAVIRAETGALDVAPEEADGAIDYVLRMAVIPEDDFLDAIAARGALAPDLLRDLADTVFRYHAALKPVPVDDAAMAIHRIVSGNLRSAAAAGLDRARVAAWGRRARAEVGRLAPWLRARAARGLVRRCHGDLHLGNFCLWQGRPVPFDALEFDEDLATIDIAYDLAFLLMDLDRRAGRDAANRLLDRIIARGDDIDMLDGLPLFLSLRAMIRSHVLKAAGRDDASAAHLEAAEAYLAPPPPVIVAIGGLQGTGKSTLAYRLAPDLGAAPGALVLRSDEIRKRLHGAAPEDRLPQSAYAAAANEAVNAALVAGAEAAARAGQSVIADSTFLAPELRSAIEAAAGRAGVPFLGVWLDAPLDVLESRVAARDRAARDRGGRDASDATVAILRQAAQRDPGPIFWQRLDAGDAEAALAAIRELLAAAGATLRPGCREAPASR